MATLYRRLSLLEPSLKKIGFGFARDGARGWTCVVDAQRGRQPGAKFAAFTYPGAGQKDVPLLCAREVPDPIPESKDKRGGYPVSVIFPPGTPVKKVMAALKDGAGRELEVWLTTPEKSPAPQFQRSTVGLIAKEPFRPNTTYTVTVTAEAGGKAWTKTWDFTTAGDTGAAGQEDLPRLALARINESRRGAGVEAVKIDPLLSKACTAHADYLVKNAGNPLLQGGGGNQEDPSLPGYSAEGARVARVAHIANNQANPLTLIDQFLASPFRRAFVLAPGLKRVGLGWARHANGRWVFVLDLTHGRGSDRVVIYPLARQTEVPLAFPGNEFPDPIPQSRTQKVGYPITVTFPPGAPVKDVTATLKDDSGREVEVWLSSPERPANPNYPAHQRNTVCLIAKDLLRPNTTYTVAVSAEVGGQPWKQTWEFTTVKR
jgi:uncharacterized protein YkwD